MELVRARFGRGIDHRAIAAKLRTVGIRQQLEFGDSVYTQGSAQRARSCPVRPEVLNVSAVEQVGLTLGP